MGIDKIFQERRSIRKFKARPVSDQDLEKIIKAASLAPTARNIQPWEFIVVKDKESLKTLAGLASPNGFLLEGAAACVAVFCHDTKYYLEDGCAATTQALLAAAGLGIGSCWVVGDKKDYAETVRGFLNVPAGLKLISLIALGYADESPNPAKRPVNEIMHKERF
ncbi:MAG TPA: nitroreductase family protein [Candidatus Omnitrophica bacterium]|nr:nitroreductase family protein [Candidatus Omnitrophota bacterium]